MYLEWKNAVTRVSHIEKLLKSIGLDGRIHASYRQMVRRLVASVARDQTYNRCLVSSGNYSELGRGTSWLADFSQVELRVAAGCRGRRCWMLTGLAGLHMGLLLW